MSTAELIFQKAQTLPATAQDTLLRLAEAFAAQTSLPPGTPKPQFGSAKGLIQIGPEFDEPLEDFQPYVQ